MDSLDKLIGQIELHDVEGIRQSFSEGINPNDHFRNEPLIYELTSEYTRSARFKECVKAFVDHGLVFSDPALLAVLLDDAAALNTLISNDPAAISKKYSLRCAYTPMHEVSLLHICAEFNHVAAAKILVSHGADINAAAGIDKDGFGGQTPIFHTVNQNSNQSAGMLDYLLSVFAEIKITVPGLIWGKGYEWETLIPAVNPISYAMMGLLPQMHRNELAVSATVTRLLQYAFGINYAPTNVPCRYLQ